jgi:hypothetical protein
MQFLDAPDYFIALPAHGRLSRFDEASDNARSPDRNPVRMRLRIQSNRRGYRMAPAGVLLSDFVIDKLRLRRRIA